MGKLISLEGIDGAGTTTIANALDNLFEDVETTAEPSELWTGKQVRRCLSDESMHPLTDFYFFMGDRVHHIKEEVKDQIESGSLVVSDRYSDSTRAYQPVALVEGGVFHDQHDARLYIDQVMGPWTYEPDVTFYIDISVDTAMERMDGDEKYEKRELLEQVHENYESICNEYDRILRINGEQSKEDVLDDIVTHL